jgi:sec-independent protein translocase protein TatA
MPSGPEWIIVLVVVLVIFGGSQLPKLARNLGKAQKEFKDGLSEAQKEAEVKPADASDTATVRADTTVPKPDA